MKKLLMMFSALLFSAQTLATTVEMTVDGLVCAFCAQGIEKKLRKLEATADVFVSLETKLVAVTLKEKQDITDAALTELLKEAGYSVVGVRRSETPIEALRKAAQTP